MFLVLFSVLFIVLFSVLISVLFSVLMLAFPALVSCDGGDPRETAMQSGADMLGEVASAMEGVTDKESAQSAVNKVKALVPKLEPLICLV